MRALRLRTSVLALALTAPAAAAVPANGGPYNVRILTGGIGVERDLQNAGALVRANSPFAISTWISPDAIQAGSVVLLATGNPADADCRCLTLEDGRLAFRSGGLTIRSTARIEAGRWTHVAASSDGLNVTLYADARPVGSDTAPLLDIAPRIAIAPAVEGRPHFGRALIGATLRDEALSARAITDEARARPDFDHVQIWIVGVMQALDTMFGAATSLQDFERKAQMRNLETHKAMFEGFLSHLWTKNSGRLLWMTHPAWPSNAWQIYSWDYDARAASHGSRKATDPVRVQINLPDNALAVVNTTLEDRNGLVATTRVVGLDNRELFARTDRLDAKANRATRLPPIPIDPLLAEHGMALVSLRLADRDGRLVSENFYWRGKDPAPYRALNGLAQAALGLTAQAAGHSGGDQVVTTTLTNPTAIPALNAKLTLLDAR